MTHVPHPPEPSPLRVLEGGLLARSAELDRADAGSDLQRLHEERDEAAAIVDRLAAAGLRVTFDLAPSGGVDVCVRDLQGRPVRLLTPRDAVDVGRLRALLDES